jgi:hypothetical protein
MFRQLKALINSFFLALFFLPIPSHMVSAANGWEENNRGRWRNGSRSNSGYRDWDNRYGGWYGIHYSWPAYYAYYGSSIYGSSYYYSFPLNSTYYFSYPSYYTDYTYPSYPYNGYYYTNNYRFYPNRNDFYPSYRGYTYQKNYAAPPQQLPTKASAGVFLNG